MLGRGLARGLAWLGPGLAGAWAWLGPGLAVSTWLGPGLAGLGLVGAWPGWGLAWLGPANTKIAIWGKSKKTRKTNVFFTF